MGCFNEDPDEQVNSSITDITIMCEEIEALRKENATLKEWHYSDQELAIKILSYLGFSQEESKEPFADRRRDRIAEMICLNRCDEINKLCSENTNPRTELDLWKVHSTEKVTVPTV